jgi:DNA-binding Lrp family transcriptional regulator
MTHKAIVDETDLKILNLIRRNARLSFREIGKQLNLSTGTVSERIKNMQANGVIKGFVTAVDPEMLGYRVTMMLKIRLSSSYPREEAEHHFQHLAGACCLHLVTGDIDMMVLIRVKDQQQAAELLESVRTLEGVESVDSHVVLSHMTLCGSCGCDCGWGIPGMMNE